MLNTSHCLAVTLIENVALNNKTDKGSTASKIFNELSKVPIDLNCNRSNYAAPVVSDGEAVSLVHQEIL